MLCAAAVGLAMLCPQSALLFPPSAFGAPAAQVRSNLAGSQAALERAIEDYRAGSERLTRIEAAIAANAARLDALAERQQRLESQLASRTVGMYRQGPLGFVAVVAGSATFDEFLNTWDALVRISRSDAQAVAELKTARARAAATARSLLERQTVASRELRALEAARAKARKELAADRVAYAEYSKTVAALEAERSSSGAAAPRAGTGTSSASGSRPTSSAKQPTGTGAWKSAVASHYGKGSYGIKLSSGVTIGPDSMIVAHKTLPFGTLVEFSYGGKIAVAKVADRGPFTPGRTFDLGPGVTRVLGFRGVHQVRYRIIGR